MLGNEEAPFLPALSLVVRCNCEHDRLSGVGFAWKIGSDGQARLRTYEWLEVNSIVLRTWSIFLSGIESARSVSRDWCTVANDRAACEAAGRYLHSVRRARLRVIRPTSEAKFGQELGL